MRSGRPVKVSEDGNLRTRHREKQLKAEAKARARATATEMEPLTHVPALLAELFDYPRSSARMMMALGNVSINGEKVGIEQMDMPSEDLVGATVCCGRFSAILTGASRPNCMMKSTPMEPEAVMGGM